MMKCVYLLVQKILFYFFLFISFKLVLSLYEIDDKFTKVDFYESFSVQKECFNIYHNNPSGPRFLLIHIENGFYFRKSEKKPKQIIKKYQLKKIYRPCESSITLPTILDFYSRMHLIVEFFLYYNESTMAISIYSFDKGFNPIPLIIVTTKGKFGLLVEFSNFSNQNSFTYNSENLEVKFYLLSIRKNDGLICVITDNNDKLVLWPKAISLNNENLITRIRIKYAQNREIIYKQYYPAFECYLNNDESLESVYLIHTISQSSIQFSLVYYDLNIMEEYFTFPVLILNLMTFNIYIMNILPVNAIILFIEKPNRKIHFCKNNVTLVELISESNIPYYKTSQKIVAISYGVKRCKWFPYSQTLCE